MNQILSNFQSPLWWLTVVAGSLVLSVIGNYATRLVDILWNQARTSTKSIFRRFAKDVSRRIQEASTSDGLLIAESARETRERISSVCYFSLALIGYLISKAIVYEPSTAYRLTKMLYQIGVLFFFGAGFWKLISAISTQAIIERSASARTTKSDT